VVDILDDIIPIFRANLEPHKDAEVRSKMLMLLSRIVIGDDNALTSDQRSVNALTFDQRSMMSVYCETLSIRTQGPHFRNFLIFFPKIF